MSNLESISSIEKSVLVDFEIAEVLLRTIEDARIHTTAAPDEESSTIEEDYSPSFCLLLQARVLSWTTVN